MTASSAENIGNNSSAAPNPLFVINLAASTSPMALSHPSSPALKRYTFFVSRQREEGRERFRLHMGYFDSQEKAEALLESVRDVYPAAWAGPAPTTGMGRRGRIAPGSVASAAPPPSAPPVPVAAPVAATPAAAATPAVPAPQAKPAAARPAVAVVAPVVPTAQPAQRSAPSAAAAPAAAKKASAAPLDSMSNVRHVLAQLSEGTPRSAAAELSGVDTLQLLEPPPPRVPALAPAATPASPPSIAKNVPTLPPLKNPFEGLENEPEVRLVTPEDTQTLTDIKVDRQNNAPPCFAVQLVWSTTPVDVGTLPHLAIFDAYTLYNVEGNRQGRKWFGLRLGFFSDPNSASQVANYVRSDYKAVAVVPVAVKERDSAKGGAPQAGGPEAPRKTSDNDFKHEKMDGFELLADDRPAPAKRDLDDAARGKPAAAGAAAPRAPAKAQVAARPAAPAAKPASAGAPVASGKPTGKRVVARRRTPPPVATGRTVSAGVGGAEVLESTLEILGASTLSLDEGREVINDAAARKPADKKSAGRFSRLLSRLSGG